MPDVTLMTGGETAAGIGSIINGIWAQVQLDAALQSMVDGIGSQVGDLLPVGIGILFVLAIPRITKRIVHTFL